ncbi:amidase [Streptomyces alkaliphilus]|uniref:amidase n=1 Tax=Streptomyces alkaliphilus TaxID=1472722 RepID=UPI00117C7B72|nr:amidase [Streptomyces alkaliphilus]
MTDPTSLDTAGLTAGYAAGDFTPVDVTLAVLERAAAIDAVVNAFVLLDADGALVAAEESAARWAAGSPLGPLDGVPASVKDILLQRGRPTLRGSAAVEPTGPFTEDAPSVARLREAGCVLFGKTTTPEFGWKGVTDCPPHGATGNPYAPDRTAGGSSGGAAAAVAFGAGPLALGTDGGGSVRIPAAFCGIFALKPTYGRVPLYPASAFGTLAHVGPMTRTVADSAALLDAIGRPDTRDWSHLGPPPAGYRAALAPPADTTVSRPLAGLRVAVSPALAGSGDGPPVAPAVAAAVRGAADLLAELGADVEEADPPVGPVEEVLAAFETLWFSGAARATGSIRGTARERMDPGLREICAEGARYSALDYLAAVDVRMALGREMGRFHERYDVLLCPTLPITAFGLGREVPEGSGLRRWTEWTPFTYPFNMTQQPAASLPFGADDEGLPIGVQLVAARHEDALVLRTAHAMELAGAPRLPPPPLPTADGTGGPAGRF